MNYDRYINQAIAAVPPSGIRRFFDIAATMKDAISLGVGEPDFVTPYHIRNAAINSIIDGGYDPVYGARPLRRYLQHTVETLISRKIIADQVRPGETIVVDCRDGELTLDTKTVLKGEIVS